MLKNTAGFIQLLAIDAATNTPKTGDAANLTAYVSLDGDTSPNALADTSATELSATNAPGLYQFSVTQGETNGDNAVYSGKSSTSGVYLVPLNVAFHPTAFHTMIAMIETMYNYLKSPAHGLRRIMARVVWGVYALDLLNKSGMQLSQSSENSVADTVVDEIINDGSHNEEGSLAKLVTDIEAKTENLPSDPADASVIAAALSALDAKIDAIDNFVDTEVAAIKAKTDNLPADTATTLSALDSKIDAIDNFVDTEVAAIKAKTDQIAITDGLVEVDIIKVKHGDLSPTPPHEAA